jgi:succinylarginine dihydrolase
MIMGDEGAANHSRLCEHYHRAGINLFVYGKQALPAGNNHPAPQHFPARQTLEASQAVVRSHQLDSSHVVFACQNPEAIDQGVFHNDVIAVANESVLLVHEDAFLNQSEVLDELARKSPFSLQIILVKRNQITITDAVKSYLFNSQLITLPGFTDKKMALIAPAECENHPAIKEFVDSLITDNSNPIVQVHYLDLKQSMRNGGGPACLRLRVPLNETELSAMHQGILVNDALLDALDHWVDKHYRTQLHANDLDDPSLIDEGFSALDELSSILKLGSIYPFQLESFIRG